MLKNLLKYEFRATARTYGGIYLALLAAAGLIGFSFRGIEPLPRAMSLKLA